MYVTLYFSESPEGVLGVSSKRWRCGGRPVIPTNVKSLTSSAGEVSS